MFETYSSCLLMDPLHLLTPVCFLLISPMMEWRRNPSFHTSHYASILQSTDVSNSAFLHCSCSTSLVLTTQASLALSRRHAAGLFSPELAWKHSGNEQGLTGCHGHFAGLAVCSPPWESLGLLPPCSRVTLMLNQSTSACHGTSIYTGLLNYCGN